MAINQIQLPVNYRKNTNVKSSANGKYYAEVATTETLSTAGFIQHIRAHNCAVGEEAIKAVITKMGECIPELVAQGQPVKIDGLGIFYPTISNKKFNYKGTQYAGATEAMMQDKTFNPTAMVGGVHLRFRPESTQLTNLTSKQFLEEKVVLTSQFIVADATAEMGGKEVAVKYVTLEDFRNGEEKTEP